LPDESLSLWGESERFAMACGPPLNRRAHYSSCGNFALFAFFAVEGQGPAFRGHWALVDFGAKANLVGDAKG